MEKQQSMNRLLLILSLSISFVSQAQIPSCVAIRGNYLFMKTTEVSNKDYREFLSSISPDERIKNIPDSTLWSTSNKYNSPMVEYYFRHPAYNNYPVVNISYKQANSYCHWLTKQLNHFLPNQQVLVRLPTEKEWSEAAQGGNNYAIYPWGTESMRVEKGKHQGTLQANFLLRKGFSILDGASITAPVNSYWPNPFGLYCMSGNVSEMVAEKGIVKGGSWRNRADYLRIDKKQYVYSASPEVGFRYVVEIVQLPQPKKSSKPINLNKRFFSKYFVQINDTLSVGKYEVSNELYHLYFAQLDELNIPINLVKDTNWHGLFPYSQLWMKNYSSHPSFRNHPVVNVSLLSSSMFSYWLSSQYKKAVGEDVEIRLPTEEEWLLAAMGKKEKALYSWGGPYVRNRKGCFLANFNPKMNEDENVYGYDTLSLSTFFQTHFSDLNDFDGEAVIAPVDSYFPNEYGLYNMSGNVAEMIFNGEFTKGGSWKSKSNFLQINSHEKWDKQANPFTGFRVVMIKKNN